MQTVKIKNDKAPRGFTVIDEKDFNPAKMTLFGAPGPAADSAEEAPRTGEKRRPRRK